MRHVKQCNRYKCRIARPETSRALVWVYKLMYFFFCAWCTRTVPLLKQFCVRSKRSSILHYKQELWIRTKTNKTKLNFLVFEGKLLKHFGFEVRLLFKRFGFEPRLLLKHFGFEAKCLNILVLK